MPEFSLIVPVYNVQDFLAECLESCINQTFKDIEIICVDDGSTDKSCMILKEYAQKDNRIKIITLERNSRQGYARNRGVEQAMGDYCWFVDSDDSILLNACEILHEVIAKVHTDIICFNAISYQYDIQTGKKALDDSGRASWRIAQHDKIFLKKNGFRPLKWIKIAAWLYISRTSLLKKVQFREHVIHEDIDFTPILLSRAESIYYVNFAFYYRRRNSKSITWGGGGDGGKQTAAYIFAANALHDYIVSAKIPRRHFCYIAYMDHIAGIKRRYNAFPGIHTEELDAMIKNIYKDACFPHIFCFKVKRAIFRRIRRLLEALV
ncbi:MAG: glycosyltransferase [Treponema sp.]|jgi:glycosyltransferase involved in cell wall biosynthesis|nr:glycosyltransferase [Treponema sp.]